MAVDEADREDDSAAGGDDETIYALKYQATFHTVVSCSMLVASVVAIGIFVACLASGIKSVTKLVNLKPENRVGQFSKRIDKALKDAEGQYHQHLVKMEDESIFTVSDKFKTLYITSLESEQDYSQMLSDYQQIVYQISSRTKGSGEWHQFYDDKLERFVKSNKIRVSDLNRYVNKNGIDTVNGS
jgi:hypothetical protein